MGVCKWRRCFARGGGGSPPAHPQAFDMSVTCGSCCDGGRTPCMCSRTPPPLVMHFDARQRGAARPPPPALPGGRGSAWKRMWAWRHVRTAARTLGAAGWAVRPQVAGVRAAWGGRHPCSTPAPPLSSHALGRWGYARARPCGWRMALQRGGAKPHVCDSL